MSQASRPEQSVMQALESLTETQVNDFLSGRSPLTLALRVGDHMMFVQLQLAAQQSSGQLQHRHVDCGTRSSSSSGSSPAPPAARSRKPGAVIESFVNHAPGVFSGTFSGTLHPNCQDSSGRPRRDIGTILQILNDRKAGRTNSNSSVSSEGSLDLDFEDSVWKPEVKADMKSEFVVA
ncbi:midnolin [Columba livia]|uniref:Midnolin n=1 Tax=Columba livia TaxID=8932 RepID=A0A2I0LJP0_COLLI|nr:midnolin [Columba livia]